MKKLAFLATALLVVSTLIPVDNLRTGGAVVQAQAPPSLVSTAAEVQFPLQLSFTLSARSSSNIVDVRLRYQVEQDSFAEVTSEAFVPVVPATSVQVSWSLDLRRTGGLPPGALVRYWWVVRDSGGGRLETSPVDIRFEDGRRSWQEMTEGLVSVFWYSGGTGFAREIMSAAQEALNKLENDTGAVVERPLRFYVYATQQDLLGAMIFPQEWTGAVTYAQFGTIVLGLSADNMIWGRRVIAHELAHAVTHQITSNPYSDLPRWLDEGLATYNEGLLDVSFGSALQRAVTSNTLFSVRTLASPFSARADLAALAYAQSFSVVDYLIATYGQDKMSELLAVFSKGSTYDSALIAVYGFDVDGLNMRWREHVTRLFQPNRPAVGLVGAGK